MGNQMGYLVDLSGIKFDESTGVATSWIQAMTVGKYYHPVYGEISITPQRIQNFADNVNNKVRETDLDIDYDHKAVTQEAAGWVKQAEPRNNGLFLLIEWTDDAATKIRQRKYKYFSPDFADEWTHPKSNVKYTDVLFGGGITNRPFLKDIMPINLSEVFASDEQVGTDKGGKMDPKKLRELLGLPVDATDEQVSAKLTERLTEKLKEEPKEEVKLSEELTKLLADNPQLKALTDQLAEQKKQLAEQAVTLRLGEVEMQVTKLSDVSTAKGRMVPPAVTDALKALMVKAPKVFADEAFEVIKQLADTGFIELGERGSRKPDEDGSDVTKRFSEATKKIQEENKGMSYADAVVEVARRQPQLFAEYQDDAYAFKA